MADQFTLIDVTSFLDEHLPRARPPHDLRAWAVSFARECVKDEKTWVSVPALSGCVGSLTHILQADAVNLKLLCPSLKFLCTKDASSSSLSKKSRPDITAFGSSDVETTKRLEASNFSHLFEHALLIVERKLSTEDPFQSSRGEFEKSADFAKRIRRQLITYAKHHHDSQPRVFSFRLFLFGEQARIIRWDRTGALVTTPFEWINGTVLPDFLARFDAASPKRRGADTTARPASPEDIAKARHAFVRAGVDDANAMTEPYYSYEVPTEPPASEPSRAPARSFVAGRPSVRSHSFTGRASTGYICCDVATGD